MKKALHVTLFLLMIGIVSTTKGFAQSTMGTDFWVTFLPNYDDSSVNLSLIAAGPRACTGTITNPRTNWSTNFNVTVGTTTNITIPKTQAYNYDGSDCTLNTGLHILSTDTISLYASNFQECTFDVTDVLPTLSLGTDYVIQTFPAAFKGMENTSSGKNNIKGIEHDRPEFAIVATENDTQINISLSCNSLNGHHANQPFTVTLDAGQCY